MSPCGVSTNSNLDVRAFLHVLRNAALRRLERHRHRAHPDVGIAPCLISTSSPTERTTPSALWTCARRAAPLPGAHAADEPFAQRTLQVRFRIDEKLAGHDDALAGGEPLADLGQVAALATDLDVDRREVALAVSDDDDARACPCGSPPRSARAPMVAGGGAAEAHVREHAGLQHAARDWRARSARARVRVCALTSGSSALTVPLNTRSG